MTLIRYLAYFLAALVALAVVAGLAGAWIYRDIPAEVLNVPLASPASGAANG